MEHQDYFEGVLQMRNCTEEAVGFVRRAVDEEKGVWIAKEKGAKGGIDFYLSSNKFLKKIAKLLKQRFNGVVKSSSKLFSRDRQTFKEIYRGTILFRMTSFSKGDTGILDGDEVKVISLGEKVSLKDTKTGKKLLLKFDYVDKNFKPA